MPLHIECEGTRPGMDAVGVNGDSVPRSALRRTLDKPHHHLIGDIEPMNAVVVRRAAVLGELKKDFAKFGIAIDGACSDVSRLRCLS